MIHFSGFRCWTPLGSPGAGKPVFEGPFWKGLAGGLAAFDGLEKRFRMSISVTSRSSIRSGRPSGRRCHIIIAIGLVAVAPWAGRILTPVVVAQEPDDEEREEDQEEEGLFGESGAYLPTDRAAERRLDVTRRLIAEKRWSDAVTLLDEILANDRDSFFRPDATTTTWQSVKSEAAALVAGLPPAGREAYQLQFRAKADRLLADAIASDDHRAIAFIARRWLNTPAGQSATLLASIDALDRGQPLAAAAWLDRLAMVASDELEPTLSVMRAVAWQRAGNLRAVTEILERARTGQKTAVRLGGRDVSVSFTPGEGHAWLDELIGPEPVAGIHPSVEWCMHRGDPARNAIVDASRPLLVPRYRVPLTRHPEEAVWLEAKRKQANDREAVLLPAAIPLAVNGTVVVHTPMGLLAVDFETGKRIWLQTGSAAGPLAIGENLGDGDDPNAAIIGRNRTLAPVFEDATSGALASNGRLVFAVESHPDALVGRDLMWPQGGNFNGGPGPGGGWSGGNALAAYDLSDHGRLRWRLPIADPTRPTRSTAWTLGAPLPINDRLFVLVEELGEVRLDVLDVESGSPIWSQPLAELDEEVRVDNHDNQPRRVAGLSPALAEGVLVCPTGAGAVVAVDLATRTLLWAYNYPVMTSGDMVVMRNGIRVPRVGRIMNGPLVINHEQPGGTTGRWLDGCPVLALGNVLLTPGESDRLHCLDLRSGKVKWTRPRDDGLYVAGAVGESIIVIGRRGVEAVGNTRGERLWFTQLSGDGAAISGRAIVGTDRIFVPLDTPEVVEIDSATGQILGRSAGRGGAVPGNLIAYRGEVLSQGVDFLDVFHQAVPLESRIETAMKDAPDDEARDAWSRAWRGQLCLDRGDIAAGLDDLRTATALAPNRFPPDMFPEALVHALEMAPEMAEELWPELLRRDPSPDLADRGLRLAVDGLLAVGKVSEAWTACSHLINRAAAAPVEAAHHDLVPDGRDQHLLLREAQWIESRVKSIADRGTATDRANIQEFAEKELDRLNGFRSSPTEWAERLHSFMAWFSGQPVARVARQRRIEALDAESVSGGVDDEALRSLAVRREFALIEMARSGSAEERLKADAALEEFRIALGASPDIAVDEAWPRGRVEARPRKAVAAQEGRQSQAIRPLPLHVSGAARSLLPGTRVEFDMQRGGLIVRDALGRTSGEPLAIQQRRTRGMGFGGFNAATADVTMIGRVAILQSGGFLAAYELAGPSMLRHGAGHRQLWTHDAGLTTRVVTMRRGINSHFPRNGNVPLGMPIPEPNANGMIAPGWAPATVVGVPFLIDRTLQLCDPLTGTVIWERRRLPDVATMFGDDEYLCLCPSSGREAIVLSMATGAVVRTCDLPDRERRLFTHGRHVFAVTPKDPASNVASRRVADTVNVEVIDPVHMERVVLGTFSGDARATIAGEDLAILEPTGMLSIINLESRRLSFATELPDMPTGLERLVVLPWRDRYLVIAGRDKTAAETKHLEKIGTVSPLLQMRSPSMLGDGQPLTGSIWAVDRLDGGMLWKTPATVLHHCLCMSEAEVVPVLLFARQIETRRGGERPRLSLLCLDKRTGAALHIDDTILTPQHTLFGCDMVGDPGAHVVSLVPLGPGTIPLDLHFTGTPADDESPYRGTDRPVVAGDMATELEYWWHRLLTLPLGF